MRTLGIYSLNNLPMYNTIVLAIFMWYITSLVRVYLITGSLFLGHFPPISPLLPFASGNPKSDFSFYELAFFFLRFLV